MAERFSLAEGKGWLTVDTEGNRVVCSAQLAADGKGLYKCWLTGAGGKALLGTLIPEGEVLRLRRTLSVAELKGHGVWPPTGAEAVLAFSFSEKKAGSPQGWHRENNPARLMGEPLLARAAGEGRALFRQEAGGFCLAYHFRTDRPFPLTPLFCFARLERLEGEDYVVFSFRPSGCPRVEEL